MTVRSLTLLAREFKRRFGFFRSLDGIEAAILSASFAFDLNGKSGLVHSWEVLGNGCYNGRHLIDIIVTFWHMACDDFEFQADVILIGVGGLLLFDVLIETDRLHIRYQDCMIYCTHNLAPCNFLVCRSS